MTRAILLLALLACVFVSTSSATTTESLCGYVYDWGTEDQGEQVATNYISASWAGFEPELSDNLKSRVTYEWAIISDDMADDVIREAADQEESGRCRPNSGITSQPDVADWVAVDSTYASNSQLTLAPGETYFILLKVTTTTVDSEGAITESVTFSNSAGITVSTTTKHTRGKGKGKGKGKGRKNLTTGILPPNNVDSVFFSVSFVSEESSDLFDWQIALIVLSCVFALLILLILIFIIVGGSKGEDKYETNVHRNENVEKI